MPAILHDPPSLAFDRQQEVQGRAARSWLVRVLFCWAIFQTIVLFSLFDVSMSNLHAGYPPWQAHHLLWLYTSPAAFLLALFAGLAAVSVYRHSSVLPRKWIFVGLFPWATLVLQATVVLIFVAIFP